jgi:hypothetical protein
MMTTIIRCTIVTLLIGCVGCSRTKEPQPAAAEPAPELFSFAPAAPPYDGPPIRFEVTIDGPATHFRWFVTVPTSGWEVKFEGGKTDPRIDHGAVKVLVVRPGPGEMVTQSPEEHDGHYRHGKMNAKTAELLVRVATRGMTGIDKEYRVAASWSAAD